MDEREVNANLLKREIMTVNTRADTRNVLPQERFSRPKPKHPVGTGFLAPTLLIRSRTIIHRSAKMNRIRATFIAVALAAASLSFGGAANAAPVGPIGKALATEQINLEQVHYRPYRHCHRRYGRRFCHGGYRRYGYGPGIGIYIGPRYGHFHRHRHHHRHWRHRH
ncbi:hypothetical protein [Hyphomicrobium sp. CS1GBMeth3]|uniref:hypothetical protein n=1 Tax=Hyphomicrobium sp. CS1GBMeth3 TaxID=1892845 RepID=UPI001114B3FD|nr:hypothetical protein [Hyphomicrobium sp. CS1GBMeth3]